MKNVCKIHCPNCATLLIYSPAREKEVMTLDGLKLWKFEVSFRCPKCRLSTSKIRNDISFKEIKCPRCKGHGTVTVGELTYNTKKEQQ